MLFRSPPGPVAVKEYSLFDELCAVPLYDSPANKTLPPATTRYPTDAQGFLEPPATPYEARELWECLSVLLASPPGTLQPWMSSLGPSNAMLHLGKAMKKKNGNLPLNVPYHVAVDDWVNFVASETGQKVGVGYVIPGDLGIEACAHFELLAWTLEAFHRLQACVGAPQLILVRHSSSTQRKLFHLLMYAMVSSESLCPRGTRLKGGS